MSPNALPRLTTDDAPVRPSAPSLLTRGLSLVRRRDTPDEAISKRSALLAVLVDRLRLTTQADGAMIALRETKTDPLICRASTGKAPAHGSRIKLPEVLSEHCAAQGFSLSSRCSVLVGGRPLELASALLVPLPSGPDDGVIGVFSRNAHFTPRDWRNLQDVARLFPPSSEPNENRHRYWIAAAIVLLLVAAWIGVRQEQKMAAPVSAAPPEQSVASPPAPPAMPLSGNTGLASAAPHSPVLNSGGAPIFAPTQPGAEQDFDQPPIPESSVFSPDPLDSISGRLPAPVAKASATLAISPLAPAESETSAQPAPTPSPVVQSAPLQSPSLVLTHTLNKGHHGWVTGLSFSADGTRLTTAGWDRAVRTWDVASGSALTSLAETSREIEAVAGTRDGKLLAAETADDGVTLWNAADGQQLRKLRGDKPPASPGSSWVYSIAFSPNGQWLASGINDKTVRVWDVKTGDTVRDLPGKKRTVVYSAFSPDGRILATGEDDKTIVLWDVASGTVLRTLRGHEKGVLAVAFSQDGRKLASASADKTIKLWDVASGRALATLRGHHDRVTTLAFTPGGRWLASGGWDGTVRIWDVDSATEFEEIPAHSKEIFSLAFDHHGDWLAAGSSDGTVHLWRFLENRP